MKQRHQGFTLIELLVVIAVIAILAAIVIPSVSSSIGTARRIACSSKLRSIGQAMVSYVSGKGHFPPYAGSQYNWLGKKTAWRPLGADQRVLNQYFGTSFTANSEFPAGKCPSDKLNGYGRLRPHAVGTSTYDHGGASYGANVNPGTGGLYDGTRTPLAIEAILEPSRMVMFGDDGVFAAVWWSQAAWDNSPTASNWFWHGKPFHWNLLFVDGHVAFTHVPNQTLVGDSYTFHRGY